MRLLGGFLVPQVLLHVPFLSVQISSTAVPSFERVAGELWNSENWNDLKCSGQCLAHRILAATSCQLKAK